MLLSAAGCGGGPTLTAETNDSSYARGQELLRQGHEQEALAAFLKVISTRGENDAPESHLQAGQLYAEKVKDPVAAIYHYRKFCELVPLSPQVAQVRQQIDAQLREFARTLPGQPFDNQSAGLLAAVERLAHQSGPATQRFVCPCRAPAPAAGPRRDRPQAYCRRRRQFVQARPAILQ